MNEQQAKFYVDRSTGTFADELAAAGLMRLLSELLERQSGRPPEITLVGRGAYYEITCEPAVDLEALSDFEQWVFPAPFISTSSSLSAVPDDVPAGEPFLIDYEAEREHRNAYFEARNTLSQTARRAEWLGQDHPALESLPPGPHRHWHIMRAVNTPAALVGYNDLIERWYRVHPHTGEALRILCDLFRETPNDPEKARKVWRRLAKQHGWPIKYSGRATANQLFNPSRGKGLNQSKANRLQKAGNVKNFWMLEWLKAVGMYEASLTRSLRGTDDRKTYVLAPGRITRRSHREIMKRFRYRMRFGDTAVRSDILAVIRYLRAFVEYVEEAQTGEIEDPAPWLTGSAVRPAAFIHGFHVAFYKDMGKSQAMMNLSFLNLPGWVTIDGRKDLARYEAIFDEHEQIAGQFQEDRGDQLELLQSYRDFIVADNLAPFFDFTNRYSSYLISQRERRGGRARQFQTTNLRRLIVSTEPSYREILDNEGFQNVAYAIRQSTVIAQWRKNRGDRRYDVRYGLGQELARKSQYKDEFIAALSGFLHRYNAENAMVMENRGGPYRRSIRTGDVEAIVDLIDRFGSDLVCKLLVAYGYARDSRPSEEDESSEEVLDEEND